MRRKDRERPAEFARMVVDKSFWGVVSMVDPAGGTHAVPLSLIRENDKIYFHCAKAGHKTNCLRHDPRVTVVCVGDVSYPSDKFTTYYESAIIRGTAEEVTDDTEKIHALRLLCERYTPGNMEKFTEAISQMLSFTAVWAISIQEITGKQNSLD